MVTKQRISWLLHKHSLFIHKFLIFIAIWAWKRSLYFLEVVFYSVSINQSQKMSLTRCAVSWQSADYWRKCHVKKYFSRFAKMFWILERFSDCKLFAIFMKFGCESMNLNRIWNCFLDLTNFSKAIFLKDTVRFGIFLRICKIFLDCPFSTSVPKHLSYLSFFDYSYIIVLP